MDFHLKQWREYQEQQNHSKQEHHHSNSAKYPRFTIDYSNDDNNNNTQNQSEQEESVLPFSLFVPDQPTSKISTNNLTASYLPDSTTSTATKYPRMGGYLSLSQWQELELQALIYRHMLAGSPIPPQLLHLLNKTLVASSYFLPNNIQHYPYFHQSMLQYGYWGKGAMDREPGRCRRTDGKKWRCSRDIVPGHKYCERHVHRGRNRSRKPVEIPTPTVVSPDGNAGGGIENANVTPATMAAASGGMAHCSLLRPSSSLLSFQLIERSSEPTIALNNPFESQSGNYPNDGKSSARILRPLFDDWPKSLQESDNVETNISSVTSTTNLSISTPGNPSSDFSLKLSTGSNVEDTDNLSHSAERYQLQSQWNVPPWGTNEVASMGGPLAEALRSSTNSSPTSVLLQLPGGTRSHASFVSS